MKIKTYNDIKIKVLQQTINPKEILSYALQQCMRKDIESKQATDEQINFILEADHQSPLEHLSMTILVTGVSRSFLAQVTRHRTFKFTSSSQHYQDYSDYEFIVKKDLKDKTLFTNSLQQSLETYQALINIGVPREEARQILPNAMAVNLLITADARNMINFFRQRLCLRNVSEMRRFARKWLILTQLWFPELFNKIGPDCETYGKCTQGKMKSEICKALNKGDIYERDSR